MRTLKFLTAIFTLIFTFNVNSQYCGTATTNVTITPTTTVQYTDAYAAGRRAFNFYAEAGNEYTFSTVGQTTVDTYLRLYSTATGGSVLAWSDDYFNTQSEITWYCTTSGDYSILLTRWSSSSTCNTINASAIVKYQKGSTSGSTIVSIGNGEGVVYNAPANHYYKFGWSEIIYLQSEINTEGNITKIRFQVDPTTPAPYTATNQKVYMAHTTLSTFPATTVKEDAQTNYTSSNYTLVYDGVVNWSIGWVEIVLETPFAWNNVDNLLIKWENRQGSYTFDEPWFYYTTKTNTVGYLHQDASYPTADGSRSSLRPNIKIALSDPIALPLELISFTGKKLKSQNQLNWITQTEVGVQHYIIEKSENGEYWSELAKVQSYGSQNQKNEYITYDNSPKNLVNYYRLKELDINGNAKILDVISIDNKNQTEKTLVKLVNIIGQEISSDTKGQQLLIFSDGTHQSIVKE